MAIANIEFSDEPPIHPNCMCTISITGEWLFGPDPCPICQELGDMWNLNSPAVPNINLWPVKGR